MRAFLRFAVPAVCSLTVAGGAAAQTPSMLDVLSIEASGKNPGAVFKILDANGDGSVSRSELRLRKYSVFFVKDENRDGKLSSDEVPGLEAATFKRLDTDGNGKIAVDEYGDARLLQFESIDANGDGRVTLEELKTIRQN